MKKSGQRDSNLNIECILLRRQPGIRSLNLQAILICQSSSTTIPKWIAGRGSAMTAFLAEIYCSSRSTTDERGPKRGAWRRSPDATKFKLPLSRKLRHPVGTENQ